MIEKVKDIIQRYSTRIQDKHTYFKPNIPPKKLQNALGAYAHSAQEGDILALIDNTSLGGAKDGALLSHVVLYTHNMMEAPQQIILKDIETVAFMEGMTSKLYINDRKFLVTNFPEKASMRLFAEMLREISRAWHPAPAEQSPAEALKKLKELYDSGVISAEEFQEKRKKYLDQL